MGAISIAYDLGDSSIHLFDPWLRVELLNPMTLT